MRIFTIDQTNNFYECGIVIAEDGQSLGNDLTCRWDIRDFSYYLSSEACYSVDDGYDDCDHCKFVHLCVTTQFPHVKTGLTWSQVQEVFPPELKFDQVFIGSHRGQCSVEAPFKISNSVVAYGVSENAALCFRYMENSIIWIAMEVYDKCRQEDIRCMQELGMLLEECLGRPTYACKGRCTIVSPHLVRLGQ